MHIQLKKDIKDNKQVLVQINKKEFFHKIGLYIEQINWTENVHTQLNLFIEMLEHINKYFNTIYNSFYSISLDEFTSIINTKIDEFENLVNEMGESNISTKTIINTTRNTLSQTIIEYKSNNNQ